ncbi:MAG TPA: beta-ribofuranosylaminobenzene 5'-phosphate synthase family protein [Burkholderiaceae bacterium]|nr:beta-ribofuranosylaminobenzene 5'-phosphate synthase family protein [Burkholderiaceae bacterium]
MPTSDPTTTRHREAGAPTRGPAAGVDAREILVEAPARLHLGFIDLHGGLGRRYGSVGVAIDGFGVRLRVERAPRPTGSVEDVAVAGPGAERMRRLAERFLLQADAWAESLGTAAAFRDARRRSIVNMTIDECVPDHVGLGSGTQAALACGAALSEAFGLGIATRTVAAMTERGARSGIGVGVFEHGGFVVDGGHAPGSAEPPPVVSRLSFPPAWRIVLVFDRDGRGVHGAAEIEAFRRLPPFPEAQAERLARIVLMRMLPGLAEERLEEFGAAVAEMQDRIGDHFAAAQGGRFASAHVARCLQAARDAGVLASGQSSWGPTGFAVVDSDAAAQELAERMRRALPDGGARGVDLRVVRGRNRGARRGGA